MTPIRVELELADGTFTTRMLRAGQTIRQFKQEVAATTPSLANMTGSGEDLVRTIGIADRHTQGFLSTLRDFAIVTGIVSVAIGKLSNIQSTWVGHIVRVNTEFERLIYQMRSMSTASDPIREAGENVAFLRRSALDMPFRISTINNAFVKLKATGTDPLNGSLQALADGVAAFGGTDEALNRVVLGISQMSGKGVIQMEELRQQLGEQMPTAVQVMARAMGVSMSQLIKDISTGMLGAKESLALFFQELDRSYGGRARYMMQTFEGQLKRVQTQLQNLALTAGGLNNDGTYAEGGFMSTLVDQLRDLNSFLGSRAGSVIAADIGAGLAEAVRWIRTGVNTIIEFREEIIALGKIAAGVFAFKLAMGGLSSLLEGLTKVRASLSAATDALGSFGRRMRYANMELKSGAPALEVWGMRARAVRLGLVGVLTSVATLAPQLAILGVAIYGAAEYFEVFESKAKRAYEEIKKFGGESRRVVNDVVEQRLADLRRSEEQLQRLVDGSFGGGGVWAENLRRVREEIAAIEAARPKLIEDAGEREDQRYIDNLMKDLDRVRQARQSAYVRDQIETEELYNQELEKAQKAGESIEKLDEQFGERRLNRARQFHRQRLDDLQVEIRKQEELILGTKDPIIVGQARQALDILRDMRLKELEMLNSVSRQIAGTPLIPTAADDKDRFEKGEAHLKRLQAEVTGLKAALTGANAEVVELQAVLQNTQKYGHMDTSSVQELIDKLVEAQAQKELLDELMAGKKKLEDDIEQNRLRLIEREMELREEALGRELTEGERIKMRLEQGYYAGFGPESETMRWLRAMITHIDAQGTALTQVGDVARNNAFGQQTVGRIRTVNDELRNMAGILLGIGQGLNGLNFGQIRMPGDMFLPGGRFGAGGRITGHAGSFLDLIGRAEGTDKGRGYNETLGYGAFTGGPVDLVNMTLDQIDELQSQMLKHPGNYFNSSAVGRYQIVRKTLRDLRQSLGLTGQELFDPAMQDMLATELMRRRGNNPAALRNEWEGLRRVDDATIMAAYAGQGQAPVGPVAAPMPVYGADQNMIVLQETLNRQQDEYVRTLDEQIAKERELQDQEKANERIKLLEELKGKAKEASTDVDGLNKNYAELVKKIESGKLGSSKDINADEYKELIAAAKELDRVETETADRRKAYRQIERDEEQFAQRRVELARQAEEAHARMLDPLEEKSTRAFRQLERDLDEYVRAVDAYYQGDKAKLAEAEAFKAQMLRQHRQTEVAEYFASLARKTEDTKRSLLSESQARTIAMQKELAEIDRWVERARQAGTQEVEITRQAEEAKAAIRAKYQQQMNPMSRQMQEWADIQGNLAKASTQWMDSLAGGLTDLIMGTGDLRSVINGILKDLINIGIKYLMSQMMGAKGRAANSGKGKLAGGGKGGKGKLFPMAHTGGIVGVSGLARKLAHPGIFAGAPRFHTGGIVGAPRLKPDEVPIIAREGEGIFTPEQMRAMGGFQQSIQINAPVTVNGSAGTPEQNEDLAKRTARQMEGTIRGIVADEMRKATRPGNFANQRGNR